MKLGRIIGSVVCTRKEESWEGVKLLLVQPLDEHRKDAGEPLVACDVVQAGPGQLVIYEEGREAALCLPNWYNPSDACVLGIVDSLDAGGNP